MDQASGKPEEERAVVHDRPGDAHRVLMTIPPVQRYRFPPSCQGIAVAIIAPGIGVQRAVAEGPYRGASQLIASGAGLHDHLPVAAAHLGVDRSDDEAHFTN